MKGSSMADSSAHVSAAYLPPAVPPSNHGHTFAAWFTMGSIVLGAIVIAVALCVSVSWLVWLGAAIVVLGLIVGKVLSVMGYGQPASVRQRKS
jgi:hypothetical protein